MSVVSNTVTAAQDSEVRAYGDNAAKYVVGVPRDAALSGSYYPGLKKEILKKDYGIDWKSPQELNPRIKFN